MSWPELTSVGRQFKLGGYTLTRETNGERPWFPTSNDGPPPRLPVAGMVQGSVTDTRNTSNVDPANVPRDDDVVLQQLSLFYAGRIYNRLGAFAQWTYDGVAHHSAIDNVDIRYAGQLSRNGADRRLRRHTEQQPHGLRYLQHDTGMELSVCVCRVSPSHPMQRL